MVIIISIAISVLLTILTILLVVQLMKISQIIKEETDKINTLEEQTYKNLRIVQYRAMDISRQASKYLNNKNSIISEIISAVLLAILPFKKIKSLIYLHKLGKKIL